ncbi:MAG: tetratricopeptide repeat protein [Bacteroidia bacterium]|nr:tetratricopeptide repeat protein [Bacteroidia bacterium]MCZ2277978.1 tetratricopeptide repeat protein [Bacteroidia bacterium]
MFDEDDFESFEEKENKLKTELNRFEKMIRAREQYFFDVDTLNDMIDHHVMQGTIEKAQEVIVFGEKLHPDNIELKIRRAELYSLAGKNEEVLRLLDEIEQKDPGDFDIFLLRGNALIGLKRFKEAIENLKMAISPEDQNDEILISLAHAYRQLSDYKNAEFYLLQAININRESSPAYDELADLYIFLGSREKGEEQLKKLIDHDPYNSMAWFTLGGFYQKLEEYDKAIEAYDYCLAINEDDPNASLQLATVYVTKEMYDEAIEQYKKISNLPLLEYISCFAIAECYEMLEQYDNARAFYRKAIKFEPENYEAYLGIAFSYSFQGSWQEALTYVRNAAGINQKLGELWILYGDCEFNLNNFSEAEKHYRKAIEVEPDNADGWQALLRFISKTGNYSEGLQLCSEAEKLHPDEAVFCYWKACLLYLDKRIRESYTEIDNAIHIDFSMHPILFEICPVLLSDQFVTSLIANYKPE